MCRLSFYLSSFAFFSQRVTGLQSLRTFVCARSMLTRFHDSMKGARGKGGGRGTTKDGGLGGGLTAKEVTRTHPKSIILQFVS